MYVCVYMCSVPTEARRGHHIPGTGIINGYEQPSVYWEWNPGPVQEQQMLLTSELLLQTHLLSVLSIQISSLAGAYAL